MICPTCPGYQLEPKELEPGMVVASCSKCNGGLLSLLNYQFWLKTQAPVMQDADDEIQLSDVDDVGDAKQCPKCHRLMAKYSFTNKSRNRLDYCSACEETWLDHGEWELLKQARLERQVSKIFTDKWQRMLRQQKFQDLQNQRYQNLLGNDCYERATNFKSWLAKQEHRRDILLFLQL